MRLRQSLSRGKGFTMGELRKELWFEARDQQARTVEQGEAAFNWTCLSLQQKWKGDTETKIDDMRKEASLAAKTALKALREAEERTTEEEVKRTEVELGKALEEGTSELQELLEVSSGKAGTKQVLSRY
ncbi:unnamed protein product [Choristocarpus tenellus]